MKNELLNDDAEYLVLVSIMYKFLPTSFFCKYTLNIKIYFAELRPSYWQVSTNRNPMKQTYFPRDPIKLIDKKRDYINLP